MIEQLHETTTFLTSRGFAGPEVGIILGTGLGNIFPQQIENRLEIPYQEIPHFPVSTVKSHKGKLLYGNMRGKTVMAMQGRFHYYEGYTMQQITFPIRVMKMLGVKYVLISNAAGNLNQTWKKGELMLIDDHISFFTYNSLIGKNHDELGPRFPDMSQPYSKYLNDMVSAIARERKIKLNAGVYVGVTGPSLETRAELRFLQQIGGDAVGMSTVPEVLVANHAGLPCCAVSVLTNDCNPDNMVPVSLTDVIQSAGESETTLTDLYTELIHRL